MMTYGLNPAPSKLLLIMVIITEIENQTRTHPLLPEGTGPGPAPVAFIAADESYILPTHCYGVCG